MKKLVTLLAIILTFTLVLAGCGNSSKKSASGSKEILLWSGDTGPDGDLIQKNVDEYNATNPEYKVKLIRMNGDTMNSKLANVTRSGKGVPDIALIASETVSMYQSQGMLDTWDKYIKGTKVSPDNYLKEAWNISSIDGHQYGVPATMGSWVMYYNKDLVDKYAPGAADDNIITYDEIEKAGAAAKKDGIITYGFSWAMQNFNNLYSQMGGKFSENGKPSINNQTAVNTMAEFKKLYDEGYMNKKGQDTTALFKNGKVMFLPEGTWMLSEMSKIKNFKWAETFTPQWDANHVVNCSGADQFAMFKSDNRSDAKIKGIVKFITWLQSNQLTWVKSGANPTALAMLDNKEYTSMPQSFLIKTEKGRNAVTIITDPGASYVFSEIDNSAWDMIEGKAPIKDTLQKIQQKVTDKMNQ
jgi:multiple sugar transport system substrate-binding protein